MPFEQRSVTYFVCKECGHDYAIADRVEYNKIYECSQECCTNKEAFWGLAPATNYNVSAQGSDGQERGFFLRMWHNTIIQGVVSGLIAFIILAVVTMFIADKLLAKFKAELLKEVKSEITSVRGENNAR